MPFIAGVAVGAFAVIAIEGAILIYLILNGEGEGMGD
jgi:hypothetical protein